MTPFEFITVALSFILGLGVTQILISAIAVFRSRDRVDADWIPLAWAAIILLWQLQYWWAIFELNTIVHTWTLFHFLTLLAMALLLFVAGALILPSSDQESGERLRGSFQRDGRWSLIFLAAYFASALATNWFLFNTPPLTQIGAYCVLLTIMPLLFLWFGNRSVRKAIVLIDIPLSIWVAAFVMSPANY